MRMKGPGQVLFHVVTLKAGNRYKTMQRIVVYAYAKALSIYISLISVPSRR